MMSQADGPELNYSQGSILASSQSPKPTQLFTCGQCLLLFTDSHSLMQHMVTHSDEKPYKCRDCYKCFTSIDLMNRHNGAAHSTSGNNSCMLCLQHFPEKDLLQLVDSPSTKRLFQCKTCFKFNPENYSLQRSKFRDHATGSSEQPKCPKSVIIKSSHDEHSDKRPYRCPKCPAAFRNRSNLKKHMVIHSEERPFRCQLCPWTFKLRFHLQKHQLMHSQQNRPFKCLYCTCSYKETASLMRHKVVHKKGLF